MSLIRYRSILSMAMLSMSASAALAQDAAAQSSPAGLSMLVLFLGIAGILGVFVIRWSQSTGDDED